jgi:hypothetical protein
MDKARLILTVAPDTLMSQDEPPSVQGILASIFEDALRITDRVIPPNGPRGLDGAPCSSAAGYQDEPRRSVMELLQEILEDSERLGSKGRRR